MQVGMCSRHVVRNRTKYGAGNLIFTQPLFIRLLEHAREDKVDDVHLHNIAERASHKPKKHLSMNDYDELTKKSEEIDPEDR